MIPDIPATVRNFLHFSELHEISGFLRDLFSIPRNTLVKGRRVQVRKGRAREKREAMSRERVEQRGNTETTTAAAEKLGFQFRPLSSFHNV